MVGHAVVRGTVGCDQMASEFVSGLNLGERRND